MVYGFKLVNISIIGVIFDSSVILILIIIQKDKFWLFDSFISKSTASKYSPRNIKWIYCYAFTQFTNWGKDNSFYIILLIFFASVSVESNHFYTKKWLSISIFTFV